MSDRNDGVRVRMTMLAVCAVAAAFAAGGCGKRSDTVKPAPAAAGAAAAAEPVLVEFEKLKGKWLRPDGGYVIDLLPALPAAWRSGRVTGLRARGGFTVDVAWKDGRLVQAAVRPQAGSARCRVRYDGRVTSVAAPCALGSASFAE